MKLAAIRDIMRLTTFVNDLDYKVSINVVASKISERDKPEVSRKEFSRGIGLPVDFSLPWDPKAVTDAAKAGRAITDAAPKRSLSRAITNTAVTISKIKENGAGKKSIWDRLKSSK